MNYIKLLPQMIGLMLVALLLVACSVTQPDQRVKVFHKAINAIKPGKEVEEGKIEIGKGMNTLSDILEEHTTSSLLSMNFLEMAMASGKVRYSNVEYELVSESDECAVVKAVGDITIWEETRAFKEEYVVVRQGEQWLIDFSAKSCH